MAEIIGVCMLCNRIRTTVDDENPTTEGKTINHAVCPDCAREQFKIKGEHNYCDSEKELEEVLREQAKQDGDMIWVETEDETEKDFEGKSINKK